MDLYDYVKKYDYSFEERPFNEVDNLVFALLSYLDFKDIVSSNKKDKITIENLSKIYFTKHPKYNIKIDILVKRYAYKLFKLLPTSKRYKNVLVYNYIFKRNDKMQFGAVTFELGDYIYISFEGTDDSISGWKEDFDMNYKFPVPAQKKAISYLNKYLFTKKKIIVGGHSKGGNLSLVASMKALGIIKNKIVNIYSNDGQGLRLKEIKSKKYQNIKNKYIHIIPSNSFIGLLLKHDDNIVIKANGVMGYTHIPYTWQIEDDKFIRSNLSKSSQIISRGLSNWSDKYSDSERKQFVNALFKLFNDNNISSLNEFKMAPVSLIHFLKHLLSVDYIVKDMSSDLIKVLTESIKD